MPALVLFQPPKPTTVPFHYSRASSQRGGLRGRWLHSALVVALHLPARFANPTQPKVPALVLFETPDPRIVPFPNSIASRQEFQGAACCFAAGTPAARICVMCKMLTACKERLHLQARLTPPVPSRPSTPTIKPSVVLFHPPSSTTSLPSLAIHVIVVLPIDPARTITTSVGRVRAVVDVVREAGEGAAHPWEARVPSSRGAGTSSNSARRSSSRRGPGLNHSV